MFANVSMTGVGAIITVLQGALTLLGIEVAEGAVASAVNGIIQAVGIILLIIGQFRRKDLKFGMVRK